MQGKVISRVSTLNEVREWVLRTIPSVEVANVRKGRFVVRGIGLRVIRDLISFLVGEFRVVREEYNPLVRELELEGNSVHIELKYQSYEASLHLRVY